MFCPNCGNSLEDNAKFCSKCGAPVAQEAAPAPAYQAPAYEENATQLLDDPATELMSENKAAGTPVYQAPAYEAPQAPAYEAPQAPAYEAPQAPAYEAPQAPAYEAPQAPAYEAPQAPAYEAPAYEAPQAPAYEAPQAPAYSAPAYEAPQAPAYQPPVYQPEQPVAENKLGKIFSLISMICGIVSLVFCWIPFIMEIPAAAAVVLGIIGSKNGGSKGKCITGIVLGAVAFVLILIFSFAIGFSAGYNSY